MLQNLEAEREMDRVTERERKGGREGEGVGGYRQWANETNMLEFGDERRKQSDAERFVSSKQCLEGERRETR